MFKKGDKVNWLGVFGVVVKVLKRDPYPVRVLFPEHGMEYYFTKNGEQLVGQMPSLQKIQEVSIYLH